MAAVVRLGAVGSFSVPLPRRALFCRARINLIRERTPNAVRAFVLSNKRIQVRRLEANDITQQLSVGSLEKITGLRNYGGMSTGTGDRPC
jgi:hypothetical protein